MAAQPSFPPFDRTHATRLDCLIWLIEHEHRRLIRWLLHGYKALVESQVRQ